MQPTHPASPLGGARPLEFGRAGVGGGQSWHGLCMGLKDCTV